MSTDCPTLHHAYTTTLLCPSFVWYKSVSEQDWSEGIPLICKMCNLNLQCFVQPLSITLNVYPVIWFAKCTCLHPRFDCFSIIYFYSFQNLGIQCVRRREVKDAIMQRVNRGLNPFSGEIFFRFIWSSMSLCSLTFVKRDIYLDNILCKNERNLGSGKSHTVNHYILSVTAILVMFEQQWYH